jgi:hypothetical protein
MLQSPTTVGTVDVPTDRYLCFAVLELKKNRIKPRLLPRHMQFIYFLFDNQKKHAKHGRSPRNID